MIELGGSCREHVIKGGAWWTHAPWAIEEHDAKRAGDAKRLKRLEAEQRKFYAGLTDGLKR
jgi:hypothetical protein